MVKILAVHLAMRGSSNYDTSPASLLLRLLTQKWRLTPTSSTNRTFSSKTPLVKTLAIAL